MFLPANAAIAMADNEVPMDWLRPMFLKLSVTDEEPWTPSRAKKNRRQRRGVPVQGAVVRYILMHIKDTGSRQTIETT